ncbi:hypothetical protein [Litoreibacter arenae]|uniref:50S ribosomal protein L35 n=1 Tax=Litoreibacter arenae DSM 19593 TaxID=1123360 RepID=S9Q788_9RHOB|nr:hypothetical protein [Litoreibacter arenae]EPX77241.1 hypothetical protein thalar_02963 [Litoreibacter arenae DSM 19593]
MDNDLILVLGIIIGVLTIPAILSAFLDGSAPRVATVAAVISGGMIIYALYSTPGGYAFADLPEVFTKVVARFVR